MVHSSLTMFACRVSVAALPLLSLAFSGEALAADDPRMVAGIADNSFLIEEAYNQEPGVVQHIATLQRQRRDWYFAFVQEWPLATQAHQISYSVPYTWLRSDGQRAQGFGDIKFNYRYQAMMESATTPAFAPRLSLIVPSGSQSKGLGDGSFGVEFLLPFSKIVSDRVAVHANAGVSHLFDVFGHSPTSFLIGGSAIYAVTREFNFLLEGLVEWSETVNDARELERETTFTLNPGFRKAFNFPNDSQFVVGFATPITFSRDRTDFGLFFYLSYEHEFLPKRASNGNGAERRIVK